MKKTDFIESIVKNNKTGFWLNCTTPIELEGGEVVFVGVKAFGLWVQVMEVNGVRDSVVAQKTVKAFRSEVTGLLNSLLKANGYKVTQGE